MSTISDPIRTVGHLAGRALSVCLVSVAVSLTACAPQGLSPDEQAAKDQKTMEFCKTVSDAITPQDKICGPFFDRVKQAKAAEEAAEKTKNDLVLYSKDLGYVAISSRDHAWTDEYIIARVPNGTKATYLGAKIFPIPTSQPLVRYYVRTLGSGSVEGWVHIFETRKASS